MQRRNVARGGDFTTKSPFTRQNSLLHSLARKEHEEVVVIIDEEGGIDAMATQESMPPPACPKSNPADDAYRRMRQTWPLWLQNFLRDSGIFRFIADILVILGIPFLMREYPDAFKNFLRLTYPNWWAEHKRISKSFNKEYYGRKWSQVLHIMEPLAEESKGLVLFVHGGAWGSGKPWMYRLMALPFLELDYTVAVLGYRTWPDATVEGQVDDVKAALKHMNQRHPALVQQGITLVGHSSGAHLCMLLALDQASAAAPGETESDNVPVDRVIGISGVYCIPSHFTFESGRGVEEISAMKPVCGPTEEDFSKNSPTRIAQRMSITSSKDDVNFPPILLVHGGKDGTVPYTSTIELAGWLKKMTHKCQVVMLPEVEHSEAVLHLAVGGITRDVITTWKTDSEAMV